MEVSDILPWKFVEASMEVDIFHESRWKFPWKNVGNVHGIELKNLKVCGSPDKELLERGASQKVGAPLRHYLLEHARGASPKPAATRVMGCHPNTCGNTRGSVLIPAAAHEVLLTHLP